MSKTIVVTGAAGDIGRSAVEQALNRGHRVFATIRKEAQKSLFPQSDRLTIVMMNIDDQQSVINGFNEIDGLLAGKPLDAVIHCAAIENPCTIEFLPVEELEKILHVNTSGTLTIMQQAMPRMRSNGGNIVIASSLWGRLAAPLVGPYAASKWALEALTDAARRETYAMKFNIVLANIGAVKSKMLSNHTADVLKILDTASDEEKQLYGDLYKTHADMNQKIEKFVITYDKVASKLLDISESVKPSPRYKIGMDAKLLCFLSWLLPARVMDKILS